MMMNLEQSIEWYETHIVPAEPFSQRLFAANGVVVIVEEEPDYSARVDIIPELTFVLWINSTVSLQESDAEFCNPVDALNEAREAMENEGVY